MSYSILNSNDNSISNKIVKFHFAKERNPFEYYIVSYKSHALFELQGNETAPNSRSESKTRCRSDRLQCGSIVNNSGMVRIEKKTSFQGQKQTTTLKAYNLFNRCIKTLSRQMMTS